MEKFRENMLKYGSFFFVLLVPVIFWSYGLFPHISTKTFFIYGAIEVLFFVWLYSIFIDKSYRLSRATLVWFAPIFAFALWMTISGILADNPTLSFLSTLGRGTGLLMLYHLVLFALIISSLFKKHGSDYLISLFKWSIIGSFILAASIWLGTEGFKFSSPVVLKKDSGGGFAGNSTVAASYFLFTFAMAAFLIYSKKLSNKFKGFVYFALAVIIFSPVFLSLYGLFTKGSILGTARGTSLAVLVGVGATILGYLFLSNKKSLKIASIVLASIALITFGVLWASLMNPSSALHQKFSEAARGTRFIFWDVAQKAMDERPVFGYGPENYSIAYQTYFNPTILTEENSFEGWNDRAHNIYYDLGVAGGYPAIILYALFILSIFFALYQKHKSNRLDRFQAALIGGVFVAYLVNNLFTFDSNIVLVNIFLFLGIIYSFENEYELKDQYTNVSQSSKNIITALLFVVFLVLFVLISYKPAMKSKLYAETFASSVNKRPAMYGNLLGGSSVGSQWDISGISFEAYRSYISDLPGTKNNKTLLPHVIDDLTALIDYLKKVTETNKTDYRLYITIAYLETTLTYYTDRPSSQALTESQLSILDQALKLAPANPNAYWVMAQVKIWAGDFKGAEEAYKEGIRVAPQLPGSYRLLLTYAEILGNKKLFQETMDQALVKIPNFSRN